MVLAENNRLNLYDKIVSTFGELMAAARGQVTCTITSAEVLALTKSVCTLTPCFSVCLTKCLLQCCGAGALEEGLGGRQVRPKCAHCLVLLGKHAQTLFIFAALRRLLLLQRVC